MAHTVKISVRSLVEYAFRSGSIDSGFRTAGTMIEGTKAHQKVQKQYSDQDQKELYLQTEIECGDIVFVIDGRCDGLLNTNNNVIIDEIKSTSMDIRLITEEMYPVHWAQAKCYAYMYAKEQRLGRMQVQLTYFHVETEEQKKFTREVSFEELEHFVIELVQMYFPYAQLRLKHERERDRSIKELAFPFEAYREGQRKLAAAVYKTIHDSKKLFAKAPTGIGKTVSTIFPSVKAIGEGLLQRIFYLTAKTITRTAAEEAFSLMQSKGLQLHTVTLTAKEKVCFQEEMRCQKEHCEFADGYYDRINDAILDMLRSETLMTRQVIEYYARKHTVCPFEFSLDAAYAADAVICDYNYIFDPRVSLKRLFEEQKKQTVLLVDEAHNLVDRARDMFSSELNKSDFLMLQRQFKEVHPEVYKTAKAVNDHFISLRKQNGHNKNAIVKQQPQELVALLESFIVQAEKVLAASSAGTETQPLLDTYFASQSFVRIAQLYDERYVTYMELSKSEVLIKMFCLDPSHLLRQMGKGYRSGICFSATLSPLDFYVDLLGGDAEDYTISIPSPFSKEQLDVYVQPLSTRYHDREHSKEPIVNLLLQLVQKRPGNYLVFFPSYEYMNGVYEMFEAQDRSVKTILQHTQMPEEERESFLAAFEAGNKEALVGFAVIGGIFSEGIDLVGDRLNGVVVVGVGLPQICLERNIIKNYFDGTGRNGFDYAYVYPGMNKVLQAGGRLIRSEQDRGTLLLVDDRYLQPQYQRLLPKEWQHYSVVQTE